jgi:hypothetical protein
MEMWDTDFLDLVQPAYISFDDRGGEFAFGAVQASVLNQKFALVWMGLGLSHFARGWGEIGNAGTASGGFGSD